MKARSVGIRELKSGLSDYLREVKQGAVIIITERGRRVARLVPETRSLDERMDSLRDAGAVAWSGRPLRSVRPDVRPTKNRTVAEILVESRG